MAIRAWFTTAGWRGLAAVVDLPATGHVAPSYDLVNLHSSLRWDGGLGLRLLAKGFIIRADAALSDEDFGIQMMISQPFQF